MRTENLSTDQLSLLLHEITLKDTALMEAANEAMESTRIIMGLSRENDSLEKRAISMLAEISELKVVNDNLKAYLKKFE